MDTESTIRKSARSPYWQNIYEASKTCANIQLFNNVSNFSGKQVRFLYWLQVYSMLMDELLRHEDKFLSEKVIEDEIRCDAYLIRRHKLNDAQWLKLRRDEKESEIKARHPGKHKSGKMNVIDVDLRSE